MIETRDTSSSTAGGLVVYVPGMRARRTEWRCLLNGASRHCSPGCAQSRGSPGSNPRFAADFTDTSRTPRVHIGCLAKEIFGLYRPKRDPFVYVADGGHRDNLGLSELLRKTPKVAFVVDASGDTPGKFATLNESIALVQTRAGHPDRHDLAADRLSRIGPA